MTASISAACGPALASASVGGLYRHLGHDRQFFVGAFGQYRMHDPWIEDAGFVHDMTPLDTGRLDDEFLARHAASAPRCQQRSRRHGARSGVGISLKAATSSALVMVSSGVKTPVPVMATLCMAFPVVFFFGPIE